jgi:hypothetical protein
LEARVSLVPEGKSNPHRHEASDSMSDSAEDQMLVAARATFAKGEFSRYGNPGKTHGELTVIG